MFKNLPSQTKSYNLGTVFRQAYWPTHSSCLNLQQPLLYLTEKLNSKLFLLLMWNSACVNGHRFYQHRVWIFIPQLLQSSDLSRNVALYSRKLRNCWEPWSEERERGRVEGGRKKKKKQNKEELRLPQREERKNAFGLTSLGDRPDIWDYIKWQDEVRHTLISQSATLSSWLLPYYVY